MRGSQWSFNPTLYYALGKILALLFLISTSCTEPSVLTVTLRTNANLKHPQLDLADPVYQFINLYSSYKQKSFILILIQPNCHLLSTTTLQCDITRIPSRPTIDSGMNKKRRQVQIVDKQKPNRATTILSSAALSRLAICCDGILIGDVGRPFVGSRRCLWRFWAIVCKTSETIRIGTWQTRQPASRYVCAFVSLSRRTPVPLQLRQDCGWRYCLCVWRVTYYVRFIGTRDRLYILRDKKKRIYQVVHRRWKQEIPGKFWTVQILGFLSILHQRRKYIFLNVYVC